MSLADIILKRYNKKNEVKTYTKEDIKKIKEDAIKDFLQSEEFNSEIDKVVKTLGDEWYKQYEKDNKEKNEKNEDIKKELEKGYDEEDEYKKFLEENSLEGYGEEPEIVDRIRLAKENANRKD